MFTERVKEANLNLSDLDLKRLKLSDADALALSYLTPGLSRRIQRQLLSQLPPSEARKLTRTLSMRNADSTKDKSDRYRSYKSVDENTNHDNEEDLNSILYSVRRPRAFELELNDNYNKISTEDDRQKFGAKTQTLSHDIASSNSRGSLSPYSEPNPQIDCEAEKLGLMRNRVSRSYSLREPQGVYSVRKIDPYQSSDSSFSENTSCGKTTNSESSRTDANGNVEYSPAALPQLSKVNYSTHKPDLSRYNKGLGTNRYYDSRQSYSPTYEDSVKNSIVNAQVGGASKISRFLRPDFYDKLKGDNVVVKEKKEREMETQKVLKEIRDKRKGRLTSQKEKHELDSDAREKLLHNLSPDVGSVSTIEEMKGEVCANKKTEDKIALPDYVNVSVVEVKEASNKKERISKLVRPKSYPTENLKQNVPSQTQELERKLKNSRLKKVSQPQKETSPIKPVNTEKPTKNKFLLSIEKKFEKLKSFNNSPSKDGDEKKKDDKKSGVESTIKRLREQSVPRNIDSCITESGLIKRAVSVEDLPTLGNPKELQPSRKSVTKILGLFKKYEEKDKKSGQVSKIGKLGAKVNDKKFSDKVQKETKLKMETRAKTDVPVVQHDKAVLMETCNVKNTNEVCKEKCERPRSLLCGVQKLQHSYNGAKSDTAITKDTKLKFSKLPLNTSYRRSLNLETGHLPDTKPTKSVCNINDQQNNNVENTCGKIKPIRTDECGNVEVTADRRHLKLDLTGALEPVPSTSSGENNEDKDNRNSLTTDDSSVFLSPYDDNMSCDSWSICSDHHTRDLLSPSSPNGHLYSGDESESVIDRIRRKSFYTRFNEMKRPRKSSLSNNYRDLDLYKDYGTTRKLGYLSPSSYGSLDRRSIDYRTPVDRKSPCYSSNQDGLKKSCNSYQRNASTLNDYVNVSKGYQTYNPKMRSSLLSPDVDDGPSDDHLSVGKSKK